MAFSSRLCSINAFRPASTQVNPPFESSASLTTLSPSPLNPEFVIVKNHPQITQITPIQEKAFRQLKSGSPDFAITLRLCVFA